MKIKYQNADVTEKYRATHSTMKCRSRIILVLRDVCYEPYKVLCYENFATRHQSQQVAIMSLLYYQHEERQSTLNFSRLTYERFSQFWHEVTKQVFRVWLSFVNWIGFSVHTFSIFNRSTIFLSYIAEAKDAYRECSYVFGHT